MKDIKCTIIQDLLPLYVDEVVSDDTKEMVEVHLQQCEHCQKEYEAMKQEVYIPAQTETSMLKRIQRNWRYKKWMIAGTSIFLTAALLFGAFFYVFHYETVILYDEELVKIELQQQKLLAHYYGESYYGVHQAGPIEMEIDGVQKTVSFIQYTETIANSPSGDLFRKKTPREEADFISSVAQPEEVDMLDAVYYTTVDMDVLMADRSSWKLLLEDAILIWEK
ncbi:zf-HC2 domain-containing protein [Bacillus pseudomycoides]|uniref:zf-HC2 domain-containing protein n=1 Tax=Bacillus pseudomycoides TaxID=64104 RepID=UPI003D1D2755